MILTKNPRDKSQINNLARQLYPENIKFLLEAYNDATSKEYEYLVVDMKADTPQKFRVRTRITTEELPPYINSDFAPIIYVKK